MEWFTFVDKIMEVYPNELLIINHDKREIKYKLAHLFPQEWSKCKEIIEESNRMSFERMTSEMNH